MSFPRRRRGLTESTEGTGMILVTRLNKASQFYINENLIEFIEETPDTIITLNTGKKVTVSETALDIVEKIREEKIRIRRATAF